MPSCPLQKNKLSGIIELILAVLFGLIVMVAFYPTNQFMTIVGFVLVIILGIKGAYDVLTG